ncbi:MAG: VTT domain-containing protein [Proteocatella sp.]
MKNFIYKYYRLIVFFTVLSLIFLSPLRKILLSQDSAEAVKIWAAEPYAPMIFILLYALSVVFALPGLPITILSGALFGVFIGSLTSILGSNLGTQLTFFICRLLGRDYTRKLNEKFPSVASLDEKINKNGFRVLLFIRLIPLFPFNAVNYIAGLTSISYLHYTAANLLGMMPATILFVYFGSSAIDYKNNPLSLFVSVAALILFSGIGILYKKFASPYGADISPKINTDAGFHGDEALSNDVLLLGGGHAHMELLRLSQSDKNFQNRLRLVTDNPYSYYSGMATGWLEGIYSEDDVRIDIVRLCRSYDIPLIIGTADYLDPVSRQIILKDARHLKYGLLSVNLGSKPARHPLSAQISDSKQFMLKPFSQFKLLLENMDSLESGTIVIAGSGAAAAEAAASVSARLLSKPLCNVILITKEEGLMPNSPFRLRNAIKKALGSYNNLRIVSGDILGINEDTISLRDLALSYKLLIWAIGIAPPQVLKNTVLKTDSRGYILTKPSLVSTDFSDILGSGDCISVKDIQLLKNGVNAVKEAPVLFSNIRAILANTPENLKNYRQKKYQLAIYNTGRRTAVLSYGPLIISGKIPWKLKNAIDTSYMQKHKK